MRYIFSFFIVIELDYVIVYFYFYNVYSKKIVFFFKNMLLNFRKPMDMLIGFASLIFFFISLFDIKLIEN